MEKTLALIEEKTMEALTLLKSLHGKVDMHTLKLNDIHGMHIQLESINKNTQGIGSIASSLDRLTDPKIGMLSLIAREKDKDSVPLRSHLWQTGMQWGVILALCLMGLIIFVSTYKTNVEASNSRLGSVIIRSSEGESTKYSTTPSP